MKQSSLRQLEYLKLILAVLIMFVMAMLASARTGAVLTNSGVRGSEPQSIAQQSKPEEARELKLGAPVERELAGGAVHFYKVTLSTGQYLKVVVEQKGIDVTVGLFGPDGEQIIEVDSPNGTQGPEPVSVIAEAAGEYRLQVRSLEQKAAAGRYEIRMQEVREPTANDRDRIAADRAFAEAEQLRSKGTAESLRKAIEKHNEAIRFLRALRDSYSEAYSLTSIGLIYWQLGDSQKALEYYNQALPLRRAVGDRAGEAITLSNIGSAYQNLGQLQQALPYYNQALPLNQAVGDRKGEAITLNNTAVIYNRLGDFEKALEIFKRVLLLRRAIEDRRGEAITLSNIGTVYTQLGDLQKALEYHNQSLALQRLIGDRQNEAVTLQSLGAVYGKLGDFQNALQSLAEALILSKAVGDRRMQAYILNSIGDLHERLGHPERAPDYFDQSLALARSVEDRLVEIQILNNIGYSLTALSNPKKAMEFHSQALQISRGVNDQLGEAATFFGMARAEGKLGDLKQARAHLEAALRLIEFTRIKVGSLVLRTSFSASKQDYYEFYIALLMRLHQQEPSAGYDAAALQASERARARSLLDILTEARADIRQGVDPILLDRERSLQQQLNAKSERLTRLLGSKHTDEEEVAARKEVEALLSAYQDVQSEIRARSPRYAALTQPRPLSLREIQEVLDKNTILLEYALGTESSYLWAVTRTSIRSFELPRRAEVETATRRVYDLLTARNQTPKFEEAAERRARIARADAAFRQAARALSQMLLGPVANQLRNRRLLIVGDGALQYLPFVALPLPDSSEQNYLPLMTKHEVINLPSASTLAVLRKEMAGRKPARKAVAILADPVFDSNDERVKATKANTASDDGGDRHSPKAALDPNQAIGDNELTRSVRDLAANNDSPLPLPRLPFTRKEAEAVVAFAPAPQSEKAIDFAANRATALDPALGQYRYLHFATHVILNTTHPELTGIVLSLVTPEGKDQNGFLLAHEIYNLNLPVELVVLSGCRTGLGKEIRGEGIVNLTRGFMYAGADRVMVSLWDINDKSTAELMTHFYRRMLTGQRLSPPAALRQAQLTMWKSRQWQAAYYWGAFVLQGEYR